LQYLKLSEYSDRAEMFALEMDEKPEVAASSGSDTASIRNPGLPGPVRPDPSETLPLSTAAALAAVPESGPERRPSHTYEVPEGGLEAWLQVLGSWVLLVDTWGLINSFGVFQTYYENDLLSSKSASDISWIGSLQGALLMLVGPISGPLYDAGYFREVLWVGLFLIILGQFMTSLCTSYWQVLLAQGVCIGVGCGLTFLPSAAILSQYFQKRRALVLGIASTGSPLAGIVFPIIFGRLQPAIGFGWATRVIAFILLGISVVPLVFMHTRVPPSGRKRSLIDSSALREGPFILAVIGSFFAFLALYVAFFYIQLFALDYNLSSAEFSPYLVTFLGVGSIVGRIIPNYLADKFGSLNVWVVVTFISAVLMFAWLSINTLGGLITFTLLYGLFSGGLVSIAPSVIVSLSPDMGRVGTRMGMMFFLSGVSILVGTPIAGCILSSTDPRQWQGTIAYAAASLMLGATLFATSRVALFRRLRNWKG
jgi:MFS family permease